MPRTASRLARTNQTTTNVYPFTVESGIPVPPKIQGAYRTMLLNMGIGDSFLCPPIKVGGFYSLANKLGFKVTAHKQEDGQVRVWKIAPTTN